ncbi:MAG: kelch repeat-containing protein [Bacteroidota bacterium]
MLHFSIKVFLSLILTCNLVIAQVPQFTWMSGSDTAYSIGVYGTKGVPSVNNIPSPRWNSVSWSTNNTLWLLGGYFGNYDYTNDLWKYTISTNEWTWVSGSNTYNQPSNYGTKGVSSPGNVPSARYSSATWTDNLGNLWLFGGWGYAAGNYGYLNDLWKYNTATNEWTWISGSNYANQSGNYGTKGQYYIANMPGARSNAVTWIDNNILWLFGGSGLAGSSGNTSNLNDVWQYNITTDQWIWMSGSSVGNQSGTFGTQGQASINNIPPARYDGNGWKDSNNDVWIFGGISSALGWLNDLWKYDSTTGEWTWISGSNVSNQFPVYGVKGTPDAANTPGARNGSSSWIDNNGLWLFGGRGTGGTSNGTLNDLWKYNTGTNEWTWIAGSNTLNPLSVYGTKGVSSANTIPAGRYNSSYWKDNNNNFWIFGGMAHFSFYYDATANDLWKIDAATLIGINELDQKANSHVSVLPNPSNGEFTITAKQDQALAVINELGIITNNVVLNTSNNYTTQLKINTPGIYYLMSNNNSYPVKEKIIVIK